jgi:hypothetical protein
MTKTKLVLTASVGALIFGVAGYVAAASEQHDVIAKHRIVVAADDSAAGDDSGAADGSAAGDDDANSDGSAKMGQDEGTYVGEDQGSAPENDTDKIDQPARRNPTTSNAPDEEDDDVMPPDESGDADQPE